MKVLVAVAEAATVEEGFGIDGRGIDEQFLDYGLNEWDEYAVEEAVRIREAADGEEGDDGGGGDDGGTERGGETGEDVEVVAVTIGPERAEETIREALATGVDRAVRVWDGAIETVAYLDAAAKAAMLAAVVEDERPDLVLAGVQSADAALGATGVRLAETVGFEWAAVVNQLNYAAGEDTAVVHRELEGGVEEVTEIELPAVLTVQTGINEPRYTSLRGVREAQNKGIAAMDLDDLGLDARAVEPAAALTEMYVPEAASDATVLEGAPDEEAAQLADVLRDRGVGE